MIFLKKNTLIKLLLVVILLFFVVFLFFNEAYKKAVEEEENLYLYQVMSPEPFTAADQYGKLDKMICEMSKNTSFCNNPISFSFECRGDEEDCLFFKEILGEDPRIFYSDNNPNIKITGSIRSNDKKHDNIKEYSLVRYSFKNLHFVNVDFIFGPGIDMDVFTRDLRSLVRLSLSREFF
jgi:hypothetical protein